MLLAILLPLAAFLLKRDNAYATFNALRLELDYTYGSLTGWLALRDRAAFFPREPVLERVLLLVKPGYEHAPGGNVYAEVGRLVERHDFVVLAKEMKLLGAEAARAVALSPDSKDEADYLQSDMSIVMVLEKIGAVEELQLLLGPSSTAEARKHAPHTVRARLGDASSSAPHLNLCYASSSAAQAQADTALFFPSAQGFALERTCAILYPDVVAHHAPARVLSLIRLHGFTVLAQEEVYLSKQRAEMFLRARRGAGVCGVGAGDSDDADFEAATKYLSSGPCLVLVLSKAAAVESWLRLIGPADPVVAREEKPQSLRAKLGTDAVHNALHGSASAADAQKDIDEFFPSLPLERLPSNLQELHDILSAKPGLEATHGAPHRAHANGPSKSVYEVLIDGLTQLCRVKPTGDEAVLYLSDWLLENNPNKPKVMLPAEPVPQVCLADELDGAVSPSAAVQPGPLQISWLLGAPGTHATKLAARAAKELCAGGLPVEHVSVSDILAQCTKTSSEHGALVAEYVAAARPLPPHILTPLVLAALRASPSRRVLLSAFPYSLDQSFDLEKAVGAGATKQLIYLQCGSGASAGSGDDSDAERLAARARAADPSLDGAAFARRVRAFAEEVGPVVEHYDLFHKVRRIDAALEEEEDVFRELKKLLAK